MVFSVFRGHIIVFCSLKAVTEKEFLIQLPAGRKKIILFLQHQTEKLF
jgi:hypothetical protein